MTQTDESQDDGEHPGSLPAHANRNPVSATAADPGPRPPVKPDWDPTSPAAAATSRWRSVSTRKRDSWLWAWPLVVLVVMSLASHRWGPLGVVTAGVVATGVIVLLIGHGSFTLYANLIILITMCLLVSAIFLGWTFGIVDDHVATQAAAPAAPSPTSSASASGRSSVADQVRRSEGRGASLGPVVLNGQDLTDARLDGVRARAASLVNTVLNGASLAGADLSGANLQSAHLRGANLRGVDLAGADLRGADLGESCLLGADLRGAVLDGRSDFTGAAVAGARADGATIERVQGWSTPSTPGYAACLLGS